ncbi:MAG: 30S ribosome-binding factor RbfA [candidate division FCPU426 bacterium]
MKPKRIDRLASQLVREISDILLRKLSDPRLSWVTITRAQITPDLREAKVYFLTLDSGEQRSQTQEGLAHAAGFIRHELGRRVEWRVLPELHFIVDEEAERTEQLLRKLTPPPPPAEPKE